jgi:hypothetical protein
MDAHSGRRHGATLWRGRVIKGSDAKRSAGRRWWGHNDRAAVEFNAKSVSERGWHMSHDVVCSQAPAQRPVVVVNRHDRESLRPIAVLPR